MKQVRDIVEKFSTSRPIFKLKVDEEGDDVSAYTASPIHQFIPEDRDCPVTQLVNNNYQERFTLSQKQYTIDKQQIYRDSVSEIRSKIRTFLYKNLEMKNPSQSKVYKWADRYMPQTEEFNEIVLSLYKYMSTFCGPDMRADRSNPHVKNTIALLEAMQEKYDKKN